jgi:hypothetical protein
MAEKKARKSTKATKAPVQVQAPAENPQETTTDAPAESA